MGNRESGFDLHETGVAAGDPEELGIEIAVDKAIVSPGGLAHGKLKALV
jgi:hypothetical protein